MASGWIKLYRQLQDCWIWQEKEPFDKRSAWIDLLLSANHKEKKILFNGKLITIERGQYLTSIRKLSEKWKWSVNKTYRFMKLLEDDGMLHKESDRDRTLITIENYSNFQDKEYTDEYTHGNTNENSDGNTSDTPTETPTKTVKEHKQECKNNKNVKNEEEQKNERMKENTSRKKPQEIYYPNDEKLNKAFIDFMDMRKKIDKPMTDRAITRAMNKLQKLSTLPFSDTMDNDLAIEIIEQSIFYCWQDFYELKDDKHNQKANNILEEWRNA